MTITKFDPDNLKRLIDEIPEIDLNLRSENIFELIKTICEYCGVCWDERKIRKKPENFDGKTMRTEQLIALKIFQENIIHYLEHFDKFLKVATVGEFSCWFLTKNICADFEFRSIQVFKIMARNFCDQMTGKNRKTFVELCSRQQNPVGLIEGLCEGDLERALKLVPSRDLARQLGISDQKLRREIYLARQRALKKRPMAKSSGDDSDTITNQINYGAYFDMEIVTCASPPSSTISSISKDYSDNDQMVIESGTGESSGIIDEWSIESLIHSDLIEQ